VERKIATRCSRGGSSNAVYRNWFLIKWDGGSGLITHGLTIRVPKEMIGKKVRLKVEIIEDKDIFVGQLE